MLFSMGRWFQREPVLYAAWFECERVQNRKQFVWENDQAPDLSTLEFAAYLWRASYVGTRARKFYMNAWNLS